MGIFIPSVGGANGGGVYTLQRAKVAETKSISYAANTEKETTLFNFTGPGILYIVGTNQQAYNLSLYEESIIIDGVTMKNGGSVFINGIVSGVTFSVTQFMFVSSNPNGAYSIPFGNSLVIKVKAKYTQAVTGGFVYSYAYYKLVE